MYYMSDLRLAGWVKGEYLEWVKKHQQKMDEFLPTNGPQIFSFANSPIYRFLSREDSGHKFKTIITIAKLSKWDEDPVINELSILNHFVSEAEYPYDKDYGAARKKEVTSAIDLFRKATNKLFRAIDSIHNNHPFELIEDIGEPYFRTPSSGAIKDENTRKFKAALEVFEKKTTHQILLDFVDNIEQLGTGNPYYLVNNKQPTESQAKVRTLIYHIIDMIGLEATKELRGIAPLIAHIVDITSPENDPLCPRDVSRQVNTTIEVYESLKLNQTGV